MHPFLPGAPAVACGPVSKNLPAHAGRPKAEELLRQGVHPREVAAAVQASLSVVWKWRRSLGLGPVPHVGRGGGDAAQAVKAEAVRMLNEGQTVAEIARELGRTEARIRQIRAELERAKRAKVPEKKQGG